MLKMLIRVLCSACLVLLLTGQSTAEMIVNGSFESPPLPQYEHVPGGATTITGWLTVDSGVERFNPSDPGVGFGGTPVGFAQTGTLAIDLAIFTGGGIQQTFGTLPGAWYRVEFYGGTLEGFNRDGTGQIEALVNSVPRTFFNVVNHSPTIVWSLFSFDFQATGSTTTLEFRNRQDHLRHFAFIDSVSVNVPEPSTVVLLATGVVGLLITRCRRWR